MKTPDPLRDPPGRDIAPPAEGLLIGSHIRTLEGTLPVEFLLPGDRIVTRSGAVRLMSVASRYHRHAAVVRIPSSSLGHDRPESDLLVAPDQGIVIRDWRSRALFGAASATIPARRLADGEFVRLVALSDVRLFALRFDTEEIIFAEGLELACPRVTVDA